MAFEITRQEILKQAIALNLLWKQTRDQKYRDEEIRLRRIVLELDNFTIPSTGVTQIVAGTGVTVSPVGGTGVVTINAIDPEPTGYGSFFSAITQPLVAINVPQVVEIDSTYEAVGVVVSENKIYFEKAGTYQFSYLVQVFSTANSVEACEFFIKYNGVTYPNSGTMVTLDPRKSAEQPSEHQMSLILTGTAQNDNDYIELYFSGSSLSLSLGYVAAAGALPATPSVIANVIPVGGGAGVSALEDLSDVFISDIADGQFLSYNSTTGKWENVSADVSGTGGELEIDGGTFLIPGGGFSFDAGTFI